MIAKIGNSSVTGLLPIFAQAAVALKQQILREKHGLQHRTTEKTLEIDEQPR